MKTIIASLGGGDLVTADNNLTYKIYGDADGYVTAIASPGSHVTDADVTVAAGSVTIENVDEGLNTSFKITSIDEAGNEAAQSPAFALVTEYKVIMSDATNDDRVQAVVGERLQLLHTVDWSIEIKIQFLNATNTLRRAMFGGANDTWRTHETNGDMSYYHNGTKICDWLTAQADVGATTTVGAFNDGLVHTYKLTWETGFTGIKMSIDGVDFGYGTTSGPPTQTIEPYNIYGTVVEPSELHFMKFIINGVTYDYKCNEGSGVELNYEGGTDHTFDLNTDVPTGHEARIWQTV